MKFDYIAEYKPHASTAAEGPISDDMVQPHEELPTEDLPSQHEMLAGYRMDISWISLSRFIVSRYPLGIQPILVSTNNWSLDLA